MFKDIDGNRLEVGDRVTYSSAGRYHGVYIGVIVGLTPKMVKVNVGKDHKEKINTVSTNNLAKLFYQGDCE